MPVTATSASAPILTIDDIRMFLRDVAGQVPGTGVTNIMFDLPEYSDDDIRRAVRFTVARYNVIPPILFTATADGINIWLLLMGVAGFLCQSEAFRQNRNQVTYPDSERPIGIDDKVQQYTALADMCNREFEDKTKAFKVSMNAEACYGSLGSGYRNVSRFFSAS